MLGCHDHGEVSIGLFSRGEAAEISPLEGLASLWLSTRPLDEERQPEEDFESRSSGGLVATRAKRRTAGNLYETLRANLDDEELQKELLAEDEAEDAEDYLASDREDDEAAMESSSSDEDADAGAGEDEGERELKKAERMEQRSR